MKDSPIISQEIKTDLSTDNPIRVDFTVSGHRTNDASGLVEKYTILEFHRFITLADLPKLDDGKQLWEPKDLSSVIHQYDRVFHDLRIDDAALSRLASEIRRRKLAKRQEKSL